jgi:hypothetical protein
MCDGEDEMNMRRFEFSDTTKRKLGGHPQRLRI